MKKEILPAVAAVIFDASENILLQRRMDTKKWCVISGHVEFGETVEEAMLREIVEETGVTGEIKRLIGVYSAPDFTTYYYPDRTVQYVVTYFEVRLLEAIPHGFSNRESESFEWFALDKLPTPLDMMNPHWLIDALDKQNVFIH